MPCRPRELRIKLYDEVLRLRRQGLSYNKIANHIARVYRVKINLGQMSQWARGLHSPYNGIYIPMKYLKPSEELAYIIGVVAGDGYVVSNAVRIGLQVKDREFVEEFSRCLSSVLMREPPRPRFILRDFGRSIYKVEVRSKTLHELLRKPLNLNKLRCFIEFSNETMGAFLRGFFDSEGSVSKVGRIIVINSDYKLLCYVRRVLLKLGIRTTQRHPKIRVTAGTTTKSPITGKQIKAKKNIYYLTIKKKSNERFYEKVGFIVERKKKRLEDYLRKHHQPTTPSDSIFSQA